MKLNKMQEELLKTIEQLQYEISLLGLDREELTGVTTRIEELKDFSEKINKSNTEIDNDNFEDWLILNGYVVYDDYYLKNDIAFNECELIEMYKEEK